MTKKRMKWPLAPVVVLIAGGTVPVRAGSLSTDVKAGYVALNVQNHCTKDVMGGGSLTTAMCGPYVDNGSFPGPPVFPYVTTLSSNGTAFSAYGGALGAHSSASVTSNAGSAFQDVTQSSFASAQESVHPYSQSLPNNAAIAVHLDLLVIGTFNPSIAGNVGTTINSTLGLELNGYGLSLPNFANTPGAIAYSIDAVVNNGVAADFQALMTMNVSFNRVTTTLPLNASVDMNYVARLTKITATFGGQPVPDFTLIGDSGVPYPSSTSALRDFDGDGRSDALLYDPVAGTAFTALSNGDGTYKYVYNLFTPAFDILRTGDFNGDGKADLVLYNSHSALAYIGMSNGDGTFAFQSLFWSPGYNFVEAGDLNGDGKTDFALYNSTTGTMYTAIGNGDGTFTYKYTLISKDFTYVRLADFAGDGKAGLFVYNASNGVAFLGIGDGAGGFAFHPLFMSPGYDRIDVGDLNGDGKADIIAYNSANGNAATGVGDGVGGFAFTPMIFSPGFTSVRLADYLGDGYASVTLYNKTTATAYFGTGTGLGTFNFQSLFWSPGYDWVEPEDVNGDGKVDVVLYNSTTGTEYTGISKGDGTFSYTYQYWGIGKTLAR